MDHFGVENQKDLTFRRPLAPHHRLASRHPRTSGDQKGEHVHLPAELLILHICFVFVHQRASPRKVTFLATEEATG